MEIRRKAILFRGSRKKEEILLNNQVYSLDPAQIICTILSLQDSFFETILALHAQLQQIEDSFKDQKDMPQFEADAICLSFLRKVRALLLEKYKPLFSHEEIILYLLTVYLPCYDAYSQAYIPMERTRIKDDFLDEVRRSIGGTTSKDVAVMKTYKELYKNMILFGDGYAAWDSFIALLSEDREYSIWSIVAKIVFGATAEMSYALRFRVCVFEMKKARIDLQNAYIEKKTGTLYELSHLLPGPRIYTDNELLFPPPKTKNEKYRKAVEITSINDLITAEVELLNTIGRTVQKCRLCGRFFVPYQNDAVYCRNINPKYNGQRCSTIGGRMTFRERHIEFATAAGKQYTRNYNTYNKWSNTNRVFVKKNIDVVLPFRSDAKHRKTMRDSIFAEMENNQREWDNSARKALKALVNGEIEEEEAYSRIRLPDVFARSPRLSEFRKELKSAKGE